MSRIAFLVAVTALLTGPLFSQQTAELVGVAPLLANPQRYAGQTIALHSVVEQTEGQNSNFKLIEAKSTGELSKQRVTVQATWVKDARVVSLQNGQEVIVIGQIQIRDNTPILQVANVITDKDAIRRFIRPSERRPRPGDNLGHDAQPSRSLSD